MANQDNTPIAPSGAVEPVEVTNRDKGLILTMLIVMIVLAGLAVFGFLVIKPAPDVIQGQGDATEIRISGKMPGRVAELYVEEGQPVKAGDTLVRIQSSLVDAQLDQAQAMEDVAKATDRKVDAGTRSQIIAGARDLWTQAQAAAGITRKTYERMQNLFEKVSTNQLTNQANK